MRFRRMNWAGCNFVTLPSGWHRYQHSATIAACRRSDLIGGCSRWESADSPKDRSDLAPSLPTSAAWSFQNDLVWMLIGSAPRPSAATLIDSAPPMTVAPLRSIDSHPHLFLTRNLAPPGSVRSTS